MGDRISARCNENTARVSSLRVTSRIKFGIGATTRLYFQTTGVVSRERLQSASEERSSASLEGAPPSLERTLARPRTDSRPDQKIADLSKTGISRPPHVRIRNNAKNASQIIVTVTR